MYIDWYNKKPLVHPKLGELEIAPLDSRWGYWAYCPVCRSIQKARYMTLHIRRVKDDKHLKYIDKKTKSILVRVWK